MVLGRGTGCDACQPEPRPVSRQDKTPLWMFPSRHLPGTETVRESEESEDPTQPMLERLGRVLCLL